MAHVIGTLPSADESSPNIHPQRQWLRAVSPTWMVNGLVGGEGSSRYSEVVVARHSRLFCDFLVWLRGCLAPKITPFAAWPAARLRADRNADRSGSRFFENRAHRPPL